MYDTRGYHGLQLYIMGRATQRVRSGTSTSVHISGFQDLPHTFTAPDHPLRGDTYYNVIVLLQGSTSHNARSISHMLHEADLCDVITPLASIFSLGEADSLPRGVHSTFALRELIRFLKALIPILEGII